MEISKLVTTKQRELLKKARETYGDTTQILISVEELCELACVCAKFPRYEDPDIARKELHSKVIDEVADTLIVLDHIVNIFGLTPVEIGNRVDAKMARMKRWLSASDSQAQTMVDRDVTPEPPYEQLSMFSED